MKKGLLASALMLGFVFLAVSHTLLPVNAQADDQYESFRPTMTSPLIIVDSPKNNTIFNASSIALIVNVSAPQVLAISPKVSRYESFLSKVYYKGDWLSNDTILYPSIYGNRNLIRVDTNLSNIPEGKHQLQIIASGEEGVIAAMFGYSYHSTSTTTIDFTIHVVNPASSTPTPTPHLTSSPSRSSMPTINTGSIAPPTIPNPILLIIIILIVISILTCLYAIKRKKR